MKTSLTAVAMVVLCAIGMGLVSAGAAAAHAFLRSADPAEESTVTTAPREVRLEFSEPVELRFSIFKVYRLETDPTSETRRLNAAAGALVSDVLQKRGDEAARADAGLATPGGTSTDIVLKLKPDLAPGAYVVMWRVLSIDTHTTQGFHVFVFARPSGGGRQIPTSATAFSLAPPRLIMNPPGWAMQPATLQSQPTYLRVSGVFNYKYTNASTPSVTADENYNGPTEDNPNTHEVGVEVATTLTLTPNANVFADVKAKYDSKFSGTVIDVERAYLNLRNTFGVSGLTFRLGRDAIRLGPVGLLLEEVLHDDDRRDGFQVWLPPMGPLRLTGFIQWALADRTTTRRLLGGRAEAVLPRGWILGLNYRADVASGDDTGTCPGTDCNTGNGFGVDLEGAIVPGLNLIMSYASYTQTADMARSHYQVVLAVDLDRLAGVHALEPVVRLWYKNFDPYTIPGNLGDAPRGGFLTPDDFHLFNVNDNLTAFGSRIDLQLITNLVFFALGEWGTYKDGGSNYSVYSAGFRYNLPHNVVMKLTYNTYVVAGGLVVTSPVSGLRLADARLYQFEVTKSW